MVKHVKREGTSWGVGGVEGQQGPKAGNCVAKNRLIDKKVGGADEGGAGKLLAIYSTFIISFKVK